MDEPRSLDSIFKEKLFRVPDYQRGYAWTRDQLAAFWEDLISLHPERSHYTGVLTLMEIPSSAITERDKEFWLVEDHSYKLYHVVDGQQRLTTFVVLLQSLLDFIVHLPENAGLQENAIHITENLSVAEVRNKYLYVIKPSGDRFRTYKFGYTVDNPSDQYLRYRVFNEEGAGSLHETFYTLNLSNSKLFFTEQCRLLHARNGLNGLHEVYKKLTRRFLLNEYVIKNHFDVFVAFETMNNRGKKLSDLELLKNRLIYLTTLYTDNELDPAERKSLRDTINDAWKEVYHQLGRNKLKPLNDDDFLRAHWTMYFKYSRQTGRDYVHFLLDEHFTPRNVHKKIVHEVDMEEAEEQTSDSDYESEEDDNTAENGEAAPVASAKLRPTEIRDFVVSLKDSSVHWFNSFNPQMADDMIAEEQQWLERLNRVGMVYFRTLVMAILKNIKSSRSRIHIFKKIERFIFLTFRLNSSRANYASSEFYNAARALDRGETDINAIEKQLEDRLAWTFNDDGSFCVDDVIAMLRKKFEGGTGYYGWNGLRYFLYEYELSLLSESRQKKVDWNDLLKTEKDKISIEHIYPQTASKRWVNEFANVSPKERQIYLGSLGNLLLLSSAINSSLQNDGFAEKKKPKYNSGGKKVRNGYCDGSHSEIEVSQNDTWGPEQIRDRSLRLLEFMAKRWGISFASDEERGRLLFLG